MIDQFTRECQPLKGDQGITGGDGRLGLVRAGGVGRGGAVRSNNGREFIVEVLQARSGRVGVSSLSVKPGSPRENGYAESFHSRRRVECLALEGFEGLRYASATTAAGRDRDLTDLCFYKDDNLTNVRIPSEEGPFCSDFGNDC